MLKHLTISNYALISRLDIEFEGGFSTITGETGAGKSILLGALGMALGQRADTNMLKEKTENCIVECTFDVSACQLNDFFAANELEYDDNTVIRRIINPSGKSRAFVNDIPVNLPILKELGDRLVDIHSQHNNLLLNDTHFQLQLVDDVAGNADLLASYSTCFKTYNKALHDYNDLVKLAEKSRNEYDFLRHQYDELAAANLSVDEQTELEAELETLTHAEEIKSNLAQTAWTLQDDETSVIQRLKDSLTRLQTIAPFFPKAEALAQRVESVYVEIKDLAAETDHIANDIEYDAQRIEWVNQRLDTIYTLQKKHRVQSSAELVELFNKLTEQIKAVESFDTRIEELQAILQTQQKALAAVAEQLSEKRRQTAPRIEDSIINMLQQLGMPNAQFKVSLRAASSYTPTGSDEVVFLFTANRKTELQDVSKVASGGEIARVMLAVKSLITKTSALPTIIFDEIDTGVSGDIADKMGNIMRQMADTMQVITITHLPQIAGKGNYHYFVYKQDTADETNSHIKLLNQDERVQEIAKMLSGKELTQAALENAKMLILQN